VRQDAALWVDDQPHCCSGCATAATLIRAGGWDAYYERRDGWSPPVLGGGDPDAFDAPEVLRQARPLDAREGQGCDIDLRVEGIHCAACTWLVEKAVGELPGVADVSVSYGSARMRLRWDPGTLPLSEVARRVQAIGYRLATEAGTARPDHDLLARLGLAVFCAGNVMTFSVAIYAGWFDGMRAEWTSLFRWFALLVATPAVLWSAQPFFERAAAGLRHRVLGMDVPIALAIALVYGHGLWATFAGHEGYLDSLTMLIALLLGGRVLEESGRRQAEEAAAAVLARAPSRARRLLARGVVEEVDTGALRPRDVVVVGQGGAIAADGVVLEGEALLDRALVTGESEPVSVRAGDLVETGAVVRDGWLHIQITRTGDETWLASMARRVADARHQRPRIVRWADRMAGHFVTGTLLLALGTALAWGLVVGWDHALAPTIAVLVAACPCALALATPTVLSVAMGAAGRRGAWIRDADAVLTLGRVDRVLLDKTGTLTEGRPVVVEADDEVLTLAAALERGSEHPIARAIVAAARERGLAPPPVEDFQEHLGRGVTGRVLGRALRLQAAGPRRVALWEEGFEAPLGVITVADVLRDGVPDELARLGLPVVMVTGDDAVTAQAVAAGLPAVVEVHAGCSPLEKAALVTRLQEAGHTVLFAGDGVNDAAAIAQADVGVAMGSGAQATVLAADVVILSPTLAPLRAALRVGPLARRALRANGLFSIFYNVAAVTAAALGYVDPLVAAILMPISSGVVIVGALRVEWSMRHDGLRLSDSDLPGHGRSLRHPLPARRALGAV
jgi:Cu2+-exporting ATPase